MVLIQYVIISRVKLEVWINDDGSLICFRIEVRTILLMGCNSLWVNCGYVNDTYKRFNLMSKGGTHEGYWSIYMWIDIRGSVCSIGWNSWIWGWWKYLTKSAWSAWLEVYTWCQADKKKRIKEGVCLRLSMMLLSVVRGLDIHAYTCPGCSMRRLLEGKLGSHWFHSVLSKVFIN